MKTWGQTRHLLSLSALCWGAGIISAFAGVVMVRLIAPAHYLVHTAGFLLSGVGLFTIALGVHHRTRRG